MVSSWEKKYLADIINENGGGGLGASRSYSHLFLQSGEPATGRITTLVVILQSLDAITKRK